MTSLRTTDDVLAQVLLFSSWICIYIHYYAKQPQVFYFGARLYNKLLWGNSALWNYTVSVITRIVIVFR